MQTSTSSNQERESEEMTEQEPKSSATIKDNTSDATDPESLDAATASDERGDRNPFLTGSVVLSELANKPLPQTNYLIERLGIAPGRPTLLYGPSGTGKTVVVTHIATCVALNRKLFGRYDVRPSLVHMLDLELGENEMSVRLRQQVLGLSARLEDAPALSFRSFPRMRLDDPGARDALMRVAEGRGLIVIDPLSRATHCSENDARGVSDALALTTDVSVSTGAVFLWVAHAGKKLSSGMRGSSTIRDASQCVLCVTSPGPGRITIEQTKAVPNVVAPVHLQLEEVGAVVSGRAEGLRLVEYDPDETVTAPAANKADVRQEIIRHLDENPDGLTGRDLRRKVGGNTTKLLLSTRILIAQRVIEVRPCPTDGRKQIYILVRNTPEHVPTNGQVIQFPSPRDESESDDV